jgi:hypothetical protein
MALYKICVGIFFGVDQKSKMATTAGHSFYIGSYGKIITIIFLGN